MLHRPPLTLAIYTQNMPLVRRLINAGAKLDYSNSFSRPFKDSCHARPNKLESALAAAVLIKDESFIKYLLKRGADLDNNNAITAAVNREPSIAIINLLIGAY